MCPKGVSLPQERERERGDYLRRGKYANKIETGVVRLGFSRSAYVIMETALRSAGALKFRENEAGFKRTVKLRFHEISIVRCEPPRVLANTRPAKDYARDIRARPIRRKSIEPWSVNIREPFPLWCRKREIKQTFSARARARVCVHVAVQSSREHLAAVLSELALA